MATDLDDKAKRVRSLLSSYYGTDPSGQGAAEENKAANYVGIDSKGFDADRYVASLLRGTRLEGLLTKHVEMAAEIKNLDSDMQMLVYENYNKFISATDTIRRMKDNVGGMEHQMDLLLSTVTSVRSKSDGVNVNLSARRERIESLNGTRSLLRKVQFVFDLPKRLRKCLEHKAYAQAVKFYVGALPILNKYGDSSFQSCKDESEEVMERIIRHMEDLVVADTADLEDRAEAVQLLEQLNQPVDQLQEDFLARHWKRLLQELQDVTAATAETAETAEHPNTPRTTQLNANKAFIEDFTRTASAFRTLFPRADAQLTQKTQELYQEYFSHVQGALQPPTGTPRAGDLVAAIKTLSDDTHIMHDVVPNAGLYKKAAEAARQSVIGHVTSIFASLEERILSSALASTSVDGTTEPASNLSRGLEGATHALLQGSTEVVKDVEELLDDGVALLANWKDEYVDLVQSKFQNLFQSLCNIFLSLGNGAEDPTRAAPASFGPSTGGSSVSGAASTPGLVLLLARLCVAIETQGLPLVTESLARKFAGGSARKDRPSFLPSEFARSFRAAGERLLQQYVNLQIKKLTLLVRKSVETPNWLKAKEPRDVRMVADLLLQEVASIQSDVRQLLDAGEKASHRRTNSGSVNARNVPPTAEQRRMMPTQRSRSRTLERDVAKLFRQKVELFTKIEYTQSSVLSAVLKICLKSFEEFVRLETFSRSGFQQIQLDTQYLRAPLREYMEDETVVDTLLDEVCAAVSDRCLDPTPLEPSVIDKIVTAKRSKQGP